LDPAGLLPSRVHSRAELDLYLAHGRQKCRATIENLADEQAQRVCVVGNFDSADICSPAPSPPTTAEIVHATGMDDDR
jgi:hypothetical protein